MDAKDVGKSKNFRAFAKEEETTKKAIRHRRNENVSWDEGKRGLRQSETRVTVVETFSARVERSGRDHERKKRPRRVRFDTPVSICLGAKSVEITHVSEEKDKFSFARTRLYQGIC